MLPCGSSRQLKSKIYYSKSIGKTATIESMADSDENYDIPFVPSSQERVYVMVELAGIKPGDQVIDLGAGDGRVVVAMARAGADVLGIEIDEGRAKIATERIKKATLEDKARIEQRNFWDIDLGKFDVITLFGIRSIMPGLEKKIQLEAKPGTRIVSNYFFFPNWRPEKVQNYVLLYIK